MHTKATSKLGTSNANSHSQLPGCQNQELLNSAIEPNSIFDLPTALLELQTAFAQIEDLNQELGEVRQSEEEAHLQHKMIRDHYEELQRELLQIES